MSKGADQKTQTVSSNSTTSQPQWVVSAGQDNYDYAKQIADKLPATTFSAPAALTSGQNQLISMLLGNATGGGQNATYNYGLNTLNGLQSFAPSNIAAGQLKDTDLAPYMDPYTKNVKDTALALGRQSLAQGINDIGAKAAGSKAFGGSRQGIQEGVAGAQFGLGAANLGAQLDQANFDQARGAATTDITNRLAADSQNAGNQIAGAGIRTNAANSAISGAGQQQQTQIQGLLAALTGQGMLQAQQQAQNDFNANSTNATNMLPVQRLNMLQSALSNTPYPTTTTGSQTGTTTGSSGNGLMQGLGGLLALGGAAGSLFGAGGAFPMVGAGSLLGAMRGGGTAP